jgi:large subunit ribosomal protein L25
MDKITLDAQVRDPKVKAKDLLPTGVVPAIFYGKGVKNQELQVNYQVFRKAYKLAGGNTIIELKVGEKETLNVLIHAVQYDPMTSLATHIDFINVKMDQEIHTEIPVKFVGTSKAVKDDSGTLTTMHSFKVKCLPKDLVHEIEVSLEPLVDFHTNIFVKDIVAPKGITILNHGEEVVATVIRPREEKVEAPVVAAVAATAEGATPAAGAAPAAAAAAPAKKDKK